MNLYKKCTAKPYSFLVIRITLASDYPLHFRNNLLERIQKVIMTTDTIQCNINRETAKISALSSGKIDRYEYITSKEILLSNQIQIID